MMNKTKLICPGALLLTFLASGCQLEAAPRAQKKVVKKAAASKPVSKDAITNAPLIKVTDPVENSFSISLPKGWRNQAYLVRTYDQIRPVATSLSPDGSTLIFTGDPRLPNYYLPTPEMVQVQDMGLMNPLMQVSDLVPARQYFDRYTRDKFGKLPGFRLSSIVPNAALNNKLRADGQKVGRNYQPDAVRVSFTYRDNNKPMRAILDCYTSLWSGIWITGVGGIATTGNPLNYEGLLKRITATHRTNPQWTQQQQQLHEQRMAQLRQDAQNQQMAFNAANQRHQMRMNAIQDAGNANMKNWYQRQNQSDANHRSFMNYITDEHTVVNSSGKTFQVDNSHQQYFVNKNDNTYVGTSSGVSRNDLMEMGLDPNDYEQVKIKR